MAEVCYSFTIFGEARPMAVSFVDTHFDDTMESVKCGAMAQAEICGMTYDNAEV